MSFPRTIEISAGGGARLEFKYSDPLDTSSDGAGFGTVPALLLSIKYDSTRKGERQRAEVAGFVAKAHKELGFFPNDWSAAVWRIGGEYANSPDEPHRYYIMESDGEKLHVVCNSVLITSGEYYNDHNNRETYTRKPSGGAAGAGLSGGLSGEYAYTTSSEGDSHAAFEDGMVTCRYVSAGQAHTNMWEYSLDGSTLTVVYNAGGYSVDYAFELSGDGDGTVTVRAESPVAMGNIFGPMVTELEISK